MVHSLPTPTHAVLPNPDLPKIVYKYIHLLAVLGRRPTRRTHTTEQLTSVSDLPDMQFLSWPSAFSEREISPRARAPPFFFVRDRPGATYVIAKAQRVPLNGDRRPDRRRRHRRRRSQSPGLLLRRSPSEVRWRKSTKRKARGETGSGAANPSPHCAHRLGLVVLVRPLSTDTRRSLVSIWRER